MPKREAIDLKIREEILNQIKNNGMRVVEASEKYGVSTKTIYNWMSKSSITSNNSLMVELSRTKRELDNAYRIIGELTAAKDLPRSKK